MAEVERLVSKDFPADVAEAIFRWLEDSAQTLNEQRGQQRCSLRILAALNSPLQRGAFTPQSATG